MSCEKAHPHGLLLPADIHPVLERLSSLASLLQMATQSSFDDTCIELLNEALNTHRALGQFIDELKDRISLNAQSEP